MASNIQVDNHSVTKTRDTIRERRTGIRDRLSLTAHKAALAAMILIWACALPPTTAKGGDLASESRFVTVTVLEKSFVVKHHGQEKILFESSSPLRAIEWALNNSRIVVLTRGDFNVDGTLNIPRPGVSLIIAADATLQPAENAEFLRVGYETKRPLIHNKGMDNVTIINLGTIRGPWPGDTGSTCIMFNGLSGGKIGIDGGLVFSAGTMAQCGHGIWLVDSKNLQVPFIGDKSYNHSMMAIEGCEDLKIDVVAGLAGSRKVNPKEGSRLVNETIDLNSYCRRIYIHRMIGTSPSQQILDVNNATDIVVDEITGYTDSDRFKGPLVEIVDYGPMGRDMTQRPRISESENIKVHKKGVAGDRISDWKITSEAGNILKSLPEMRVRVRVIGNPHKEKITVLDRTYQFNLEEMPEVSVVE